MSASSARCWSVDTYNPIPGYSPKTPACNNYDGGFACDLMLKDLKLALEAADAAKIDAILGSQSKKIYEGLSQSGKGRKDFSVIYDEILKNYK
jgi:3-hydroxyisobutyrate dehydrogenase